MQSNHKAHDYHICQSSWCLVWMLLARDTINGASPQGVGIQYQDDLI